jgi:hypothetical protein
MVLLENRFQQSQNNRSWSRFGVVRRNFVKTQLIKRGSEKLDRFKKNIADKSSSSDIS